MGARGSAQGGREGEVTLPQQQDAARRLHLRSQSRRPPALPHDVSAGQRAAAALPHRLLAASGLADPDPCEARSGRRRGGERRLAAAPGLRACLWARRGRGFSPWGRPGLLRASPVLCRQPLPLRDPLRRAQMAAGTPGEAGSCHWRAAAVPGLRVTAWERVAMLCCRLFHLCALSCCTGPGQCFGSHMSDDSRRFKIGKGKLQQRPTACS